MSEVVAFYALAAFILGLGVLVITARNTVHCVLFLVLNFLGVAALYVLLHAEFVAVIQVLVYAGGIVVLYLFVVMLVNLRRPPEVHADRYRYGRLGLVMGGLVLAQLAAVIFASTSGPAPGPVTVDMPVGLTGNVERVGWLLYTDYLIPFELASILLLVAMVGAMVLARRDL